MYVINNTNTIQGSRLTELLELFTNRIINQFEYQIFYGGSWRCAMRVVRQRSNPAKFKIYTGCVLEEQNGDVIAPWYLRTHKTPMNEGCVKHMRQLLSRARCLLFVYNLSYNKAASVYDTSRFIFS